MIGAHGVTNVSMIRHGLPNGVPMGSTWVAHGAPGLFLCHPMRPHGKDMGFKHDQKFANVRHVRTLSYPYAFASFMNTAVPACAPEPTITNRYMPNTKYSYPP